jgi:hypothetical protein
MHRFKLRRQFSNASGRAVKLAEQQNGRAIVPHGQNCVTEDAELLFRHHRAQNRAKNACIGRRRAAEKWGVRDDAPPGGGCALPRDWVAYVTDWMGD